jgi:hypothetical protein
MEHETVLWLAAAALWGTAGAVCLLRRRRPAGAGRQALLLAAAGASVAALNAHDSNRQVVRLRSCLLTTLDIAAAPDQRLAPVRLVRSPG